MCRIYPFQHADKKTGDANTPSASLEMTRNLWISTIKGFSSTLEIVFGQKNHPNPYLLKNLLWVLGGFLFMDSSLFFFLGFLLPWLLLWVCMARCFLGGEAIGVTSLRSS